MTMMLVTERKRWAHLVDDILIESRRGSQKARAWFSGDTWLSIREHVFKTEVIAEIEAQALAVYSEHKVRFEPPVTKSHSPEELKRIREQKLASFHRRKAARKAAKQAELAAIAKSFNWPSQLGVTHNGNQTATT